MENKTVRMVGFIPLWRKLITGESYVKPTKVFATEEEVKAAIAKKGWHGADSLIGIAKVIYKERR